MEFKNTKEAAEILQVTKMTISRMVKSGKLKPIYFYKSFFLFNNSDILFFKENKQLLKTKK